MSFPLIPNALILPYPAQGHVIPFMELSYWLIDHGFRITFLNTEFNHKRIFAAIMSDQPNYIGGGTDGIHFITIPDGLNPEDDRNNFGRLTKSMMTVMPNFLEELIVNSAIRFTCFIVDINMAWTLNITKNLGLRSAALWPAAVGTLSTLFNIPKLIEDGIINEDGSSKKKEDIQLSPGLPTMDITNLPWNFFDDTCTQKIMFNCIITNIQAASNLEMIICNSFEELEKPVFDKIPNILPVGPLNSNIKSREDPNLCYFWAEDKKCIAWLNKQSTRSVVYVAFGSISTINNYQFQELALGLELTGRPFLWVVRKFNAKSITCTYPLGFKERVANRGRLVDWAPQHKVLKHPAIACFISHCGWNSTIEGVHYGVPFICWPYFTDQFLNQTYITKIWTIGLSFIPDESGLISKDEVRSKVEELLSDKDILARSQALKNFSQMSVIEGGSSFNNLKKFVDFIKGI